MSPRNSLFFPLFLSAILVSPLPRRVYAQSASSGPTVTERHQKVFEALVKAKIVNPQSPAAPFNDLIGEVNDWATKQDLPSIANLDDRIADAFPKPWERMARSSQFKVEGQEQPRTVLAYPSPMSTMTVPILNPDHVLFKYTVSSRASDYFPTTQDVADQAKAFTDAGGTKLSATEVTGPNKGHVANLLCKQLSNIDAIAACLSKTRKRDFAYRFVSGFSGTFSYSDNPEVVQNILIQNDTAESKRNRLFSGEVIFDPSNVFVSGTDWKNAVAAAAIYEPEVMGSLKRKAEAVCDVKFDPPLVMLKKRCLDKLAGPTGWKAVGAAFLPTVDYKIQTQFDFIKSGANFVEPPYPLGHLYDFSFTQDLRRVFPTAKQREDAVVALSTLLKQKQSKAVPPSKLTLLADFKTLTLDEDRLLQDVWYYKFLDEIAAFI